MPTVPTYGTRRVRATPLPDAQVETRQAVPTAANFGSLQGEALQQLGEQGVRTSLTLLSQQAQMAAEAKRRADQVAVIASENELDDFLTPRLYDPKSGALNVRGREAAGLPETIGEEFDNVAGSLTTKLTSDRQREDFARVVQNKRGKLKEILMRHVSAEIYRADTDETGKSLGNRQNDAITAAAGDPKLLPVAIKRVVQEQTDTINQFAIAHGLGPEARQDMLDEAITKTHAGVIQQLLVSGQDRYAQAYFDETKDQIKGFAKTELMAKLQSGTTAGTALRAGKDIWAQLGPKDPKQSIELDAMITAAEERFADEPKVLEQTVRWLEAKARTTKTDRNQADDVAASKVWQAIANGAGLSDLPHIPEYLELPGKEQATIRDYVSRQIEHAASLREHAANIAYANESRAYTREQRAEKERDDNGLYMYYQYANPDVASKMTDEQVWALMPKIGKGNVARLLEQRHKFTKDPTAIDDFRSDTAVINGVLEANRIDPTPTDKDPAGRAKVGWFREQVAAEQRRVQEITKKKVSNEELEAIAKRILGQQVLSRGWFTDTTQNLMKATIKDVSPHDRTEIRAAFERQGVGSPTDDQILFVWLDQQTQKKK